MERNLEVTDNSALAKFQTNSHQSDVQGHSAQPSPAQSWRGLFEHFNSSSVVNSMTKVGLAVLKGSSPGPGPPEKWVEVEVP